MSLNSVPELLNNGKGIGKTLSGALSDAKELIFGEESEGKFKIRDPEILSYPEGLDNSKDGNSFIKIVETKISKNAQPSKDKRNVGDLVGKATDESKALMALPFPQNIVLAENYSWGSDELGLASAILGNQNVESVGQQALTALKHSAVKGAENVSGLNLKGALAAREQRIKNPRAAALFKNVDFRQFNLEYSFAPKSEKEAKTVIKAIRLIRSNAAPTLDENNDYLGFPNRFDITVNNGQYPLASFKNCVATSVTTNYTPDGILATLRGGLPVHVTLAISFMETEIVTRERILKGEV